MKNESMKCFLIALLAVMGMAVIFKDKDTLLLVTEEQLAHYIPLIVIDLYFATSLIFIIMAISLYKMRSDKESIGAYIMDKTVCTFAIVFLTANTVVLFMHAVNQYPSGMWSKIELSLSAITLLGVIFEGILLVVIWRTICYRKHVIEAAV